MHKQHTTVTVWRFTDGRPGHDIQSLGLVQALQQQIALSVFELDVSGCGSGTWYWLTGRYPPGADLPTPDVLLGAGHATHLHLLAARRHRGGRIILLMKPSLPLSCFDLCLVPQHDTVPQVGNVLATRGVLNTITPGVDHDEQTGLIVLGGPSRHFEWDDHQLLEQIEQLLESRVMKRWVLTTSRRTPEALTRRLAEKNGFDYAPYAGTTSDWLPAMLDRAGEVWVSEDSVSMIYEALTSGARVGILKVPRRRANRVTREVDDLVAKHWVGIPGQMQLPQGPVRPLNEAARCAEWIREQWLDAR